LPVHSPQPRSAGTFVLCAALLCDASACGPQPYDAEDQPPAEFICQDARESDPYIDCVDSFLPGDASFGHDLLPGVLLGPPQGAGALGGSDVVSLGCGGEITLYFAGDGIVDGPGDDLIIFENPFALGDGTFVEPARVLVSDDGIAWREFPCDLDAHPPRGCAGIELVHAEGDGPGSPDDPRDLRSAGGDAFDLAQVELDRARWVRLIDVGEAYYGDRLWCAGEAGGFDLDAIVALHAAG